MAGAKAGPVPAHPIGIWLGVSGPRALSLTGRSADGWVPSASYIPPSQLPDASARIDEAAHSVGRQPADIRRVYNVNGVITNGESGGFLNGPVQQWVDELTDLAVGYGMDTFVFWPESDQLSQLQRFAAEVIPRVHEEVAAERG